MLSDIANGTLRESKPAMVSYNKLLNILETGIVTTEVENYPELDKSSFQSELMVFRKQWPASISLNIQKFNELLHSKQEHSIFPNIENLLKLFLIWPVSSAESERSFSALRRLKNWLRSTMTQTRLNAVAISHVHKNIAESLNKNELVNNFLQRIPLRVQLFSN